MEMMPREQAGRAPAAMRADLRGHVVAAAELVAKRAVLDDEHEPASASMVDALGALYAVQRRPRLSRPGY